MNTIIPLIRQIAVMFILMGAGYILYKSKKISNAGSREMGTILLYLVIPAVIINSFCIERNAENMNYFLSSSLVSLIAAGIACAVSWFAFGRKDGIACFSSAFSNAGFIGIPLVTAAVGPQAVMFVSTMIVLVNLLQWTFGVFVLTGDRSAMSPQKVLTNPTTIGLCIGLAVFLLKISIPDFGRSILTSVTARIRLLR